MFDTFTRTPFFGLTLIFICWVLGGSKFQKKSRLAAVQPGADFRPDDRGDPDGHWCPSETFQCGGIHHHHAAGTGHGGAGPEYLSAAEGAPGEFPAHPGGMHHRQSGEHHSSSGPVPSVRGPIRCFPLPCCPKSVTTAIALGISENGGGIPGITAGAVVITGIEGAVLAPFLGKLFHITDPVAEGVAIGACSHAVGTSKALEIGKIQGAMSSISLCVCGIITTGLALFFM